MRKYEEKLKQCLEDAKKTIPSNYKPQSCAGCDARVIAGQSICAITGKIIPQIEIINEGKKMDDCPLD